MDNNALESKMPIQGKMLSSTFYTVLDNFESDGTCFTTDDDLECSDNTECKWDVPARAKLSKHGHRDFVPTSDESIPIIHCSNKTRNVTGNSTNTVTGNDSKLELNIEPQNQAKLALSELTTELLDSRSEKVPGTLIDVPQNQLPDSSLEATSSRTIWTSKHHKSANMSTENTGISKDSGTIIPLASYDLDEKHRLPPSEEQKLLSLTGASDNEGHKLSTLTDTTNGKRSIDKNRSPNDSPPMFHECIKFYKEMCEQLTNEKNQLDEEKKHIQQDLSKLQTEIKENANSVKVLEDKMERLQLKRSGHRSSIVVLPEEAKSESAASRILNAKKSTDQSHKPLQTSRDRDRHQTHSSNLERSSMALTESETQQHTTALNLERSSKEDEVCNNLDASSKVEDNIDGDQQSAALVKASEEGDQLSTGSKALSVEDKDRITDSIRDKYNRACQQFNSIEESIQQHWKGGRNGQQLSSVNMDESESCAQEKITVSERPLKHSTNVSKTECLEVYEQAQERSVDSTVREEPFGQENRSTTGCEGTNELLSSEMKLKIHALEEELSTAHENFRLVERDLNEAIERAGNAEKGLSLFKEETEKLKQQLYFHCDENKLEKMKLEEQNAAAEHKVSAAEKTVREIKNQLIKMTDRAVGAEKELSEVTQTVKLLKKELSKFQRRVQKAEEEFVHAQMRFSNQKEDLIKKANGAENALVNIKNTVQAAEIKIQEVEQNFAEVEDALSKVKMEADEKIAQLKQKLICSMEKAESAETELYTFQEKFKVAERELQKANDRAEQDMKAKCHTENLLKESLERAEREVDEARAKLHRVEKVLANGMGSSEQNSTENYVLNSTGSVYELRDRDAKAVTTRVIGTRHSCPIVLQNKDELSKLQRILNGCMESTRAHFTASTTSTQGRSDRETSDTMFLKSRLKELASENAELKSCLTERKSSPKQTSHRHVRKEKMRKAIATLEHKNNELRNKVAQQKYEFFTKPESVKYLPTPVLRSKRRNSHTCRTSSHANNQTTGTLNPECAVESQCDKIQDKLTAFINNLKDAQENILHSRDAIAPTKTEQWYAIQVDHPGKGRMGASLQGHPGSENKKMVQALKEITGLTSQEYMKLQNMKKWLGAEGNASVQLNVSRSEAEVGKVTSEISNKMRRLSRHFQNVEVNTVMTYMPK